MNIRKAKSSDAKDIINVNVKTWCTTYKGIIPDSILQHKLDTMDESIKKCEETVEKKDNVLVAEYDNKVVGIVSYGKAKVVDDDMSGEIYSIYVLDEYQGKKIGKELFLAAKDILIQKGYNKIVLTCIKQNPSNAFYKKMGGNVIDKVVSNIGGAEIEENLIEFNI